MRSLLVIVLLVSGCTRAAAAPWVPTLTLRGGLVSREGSSASLTRSRSDWQIVVDLRWTPSRRVPRVPAPAVPAPRVDSSVSVCGDAALCAWERRSRARALSAWDASR